MRFDWSAGGAGGPPCGLLARRDKGSDGLVEGFGGEGAGEEGFGLVDEGLEVEDSPDSAC